MLHLGAQKGQCPREVSVAYMQQRERIGAGSRAGLIDLSEAMHVEYLPLGPGGIYHLR